MQHIAQMPRLTKLAKRNRNGALRVLLTTGLLVGATLASFVLVTVLSTGL